MIAAMTYEDTNGDRMRWDETLRQWVPITGSLSPAELAAEIGLTAHLADTDDAHDASAISVLDAAGYFDAANVESALAETRTRFRPYNALLGVILGDSVSLGGGDQSANYVGDSWIARLQYRTDGKVRLVRNAGIAGNTSTQMLARLSTDVLAYSPGWCALAMITPNDIATITKATAKANIISAADQLEAAGIRPIIVLGPPSDTTATRDFLVSMNAWAQGWAALRGYHVWDIYTPLADTADGTYASANTSDGIHPNATGREAIATYLSTRLPAWMTSPILSCGLNDADNLCTNGCFVGDTNADGVANSWSAVGGGISAKALTAMSSSEGFGNWQKITNGTGLGYLEGNTFNVTAGRVLEFAGKCKVSDATIAVTAKVTYDSGTAPQSVVGPVMLTTFGTWYQRFVVPVGATTGKVQLLSQTVAGDVYWGQITVRDLTALGVV